MSGKGGALLPLLVLRSVSAANVGSCFVASGFGPLHGFGSCRGCGSGLTRRGGAPAVAPRSRWLISAADAGKDPGSKGPKPKTLSIDRMLQQQGFGTRKFCKSLVKEVSSHPPLSIKGGFSSPPLFPGRGCIQNAFTIYLWCAGIRHCSGARSDRSIRNDRNIQWDAGEIRVGAGRACAGNFGVTYTLKKLSGHLFRDSIQSTTRIGNTTRCPTFCSTSRRDMSARRSQVTTPVSWTFFPTPSEVRALDIATLRAVAAQIPWPGRNFDRQRTCARIESSLRFFCREGSTECWATGR